VTRARASRIAARARVRDGIVAVTVMLAVALPTVNVAALDVAVLGVQEFVNTA